MQECCFKERQISYRQNTFRTRRPTLVLIHGHGSSSSEWAQYEPAFEGIYHLVEIDLRGHGMSSRPHSYDQYHPREAAHDILRLLSKLGIEKCILVAHSIGALVAIEILESKQKDVVGVILVSPAYNSLPLKRFIHPLLVGLTPFIDYLPLAEPRQRVDYTRFKGSGECNLRRTYAEIRATGIRSFLFWMRCAYETVRDDRWHSLGTLPVLILHGRSDSITKIEHAESLALAMASSKLISFERENHLLLLNQREKIVVHIHSFVRTVDTVIGEPKH
jgi:pimeloyl-ACP methyl ester carboxylesterase